MCGICGIVSRNNIDPEGVLHKMNNAIFHRGPDDEGYYTDENIGLAMRRLSIIDLDTGHQPMLSSDGRFVIVFNGEIYNYKKLRQLYLSDIHFNTQSDTEVVLNLFQKFGVSSLNYLKGMFAFSIYDNIEKSFILVRDRLGIKPLFYYDDKNFFLFSSEAKSFYKIRELDFTYDNSTFADYLTSGYIPQPFSVFKEVKKLPPGSILVYKNGSYNIVQYWSIPDFLSEKVPFQQSVEKVRGLVLESIKEHMVSDVPIGSFLSGGIDSSIVTYGMSLNQKEVRTFTIGFNGATNTKDLELSRLIAEKYSTIHKETILDIGILPEYTSIIEKMDEPFAISSLLPLYLNSRFTRDYVTVALSGDGADELFGGYNRYRQFERLVNMGRLSTGSALVLGKVLKTMASIGNSKKLAKGYYHLIKPLADFSSGSNIGLKYLSLFKHNQPSYLEKILGKDFLDKNTDQRYIERTDKFLKTYTASDNNSLILYDMSTSLVDEMLTKVDIASMLNSLEVRVPFLDHELVEEVMRMPFEYKIGKTNKYILKEAFKEILPKEVLLAPKRGFNLPLDLWIKTSWKDSFLDVFQESSLNDLGINKATLIREFTRFTKSSNPGGKIYFYIFTFLLWDINYQSQRRSLL